MSRFRRRFFLFALLLLPIISLGISTRVSPVPTAEASPPREPLLAPAPAISVTVATPIQANNTQTTNVTVTIRNTSTVLLDNNTNVAMDYLLDADLNINTDVTTSCGVGGTDNFTATVATRRLVLTATTLTPDDSAVGGTDECSITFAVRTSTVGNHDVTPQVTSTQGNRTATAVPVRAYNYTVTLAYVSGTGYIANTGTSATTLRFTIAPNANNPTAINDIDMTFNLPGDLEINGTQNQNNACGTGGDVTAPDGGKTITLADGQRNAGQNCSFDVSVSSETGNPPGQTHNLTATVTASTASGGSFSSSSSALAIFIVEPVTATLTVSKGAILSNNTDSANLTYNIVNPNPFPVTVSSDYDTPDSPNEAIEVNAATTSVCGGTNNLVTTASGDNITLNTTTLGADGTATDTCNFSVPVFSNSGNGDTSFTATIQPTINIAGISGFNVSPSVTIKILDDAFSANTTITIADRYIRDYDFPPASGTTTLVTFTINNPADIAITISNFSLTLGNLEVTGSPPATVCGGASLNTSGTLSFSNGTMAASDVCSFIVTLRSNDMGSYLLAPTVSFENNSSLTMNLTTSATNRTINVMEPVNLAYSFSANPILATGTDSSTLTITISNPNSFAISDIDMTAAFGLTDLNITSTSVPDDCGTGDLTITPGSPDTFRLLNGNLDANNGSPGGSDECNIAITFNSTVPGDYNINPSFTAENVTTTSQLASPTTLLSVVAAPELTVSVTNPHIERGDATDTATITYTIENTASVAVNNIAFSHNITNLIVTSPTLPANIATCFGESLTLSSNTLSIADIDIPGFSTCIITVTVRSDTVGLYDTQPTFTIDGGPATDGSGFSLKVINPITVDVSTVASDNVLENDGTDTINITYTITNPNATVDVVDIDMTVSHTNLVRGTLDGASTCNGTTTGATSTTNRSNITLAGGASCTLIYSYSSSTAALYNVHPTVTAETDPEVTATTTDTDTTTQIKVMAPLTFSLSLPDPYTENILADTTTLTFNIGNPNNFAAMNNITMLFDLPGDLDVAAISSQSICGGNGVLDADSNSDEITITISTLAASGNCSFDVTIFSDTAGQYSLAPTINAETTNAEPDIPTTATAVTLFVHQPLTVTLNITNDAVLVGGTSNLQIQITNPNTFNVGNLTIPSYSLPLGVDLTAYTNIVTCGGTVTRTNGVQDSFQFSGGSLTNGANCTITIPVVGVAVGQYSLQPTVTIQNGNVVTTPTAVTLKVISPLTFSVSVSDNAIAGDTIEQTIITYTITNSNPFVIADVDSSFTLPSAPVNLNIDASSYTCGSGTLNTAGDVIVLSNLDLAASPGPGNTCTFTVTIHAVNNSVASRVENLNPSINIENDSLIFSASPNAILTIFWPPTVYASFATITPPPPAPTLDTDEQVPLNAIVPIHYLIDNNEIIAASLSFTHNLPTNVVIATPSNATNTCGGTFTATSGTTVVTLTGGTLSAGTHCEIRFDVTSGTPATPYLFQNYLLNSNVGRATFNTLQLTVIDPSGIGIQAAFDGSASFKTDIVRRNGGLSEVFRLTYTITNSNPAPIDGLTLSANLATLNLQVANPAGYTFSAGCLNGAGAPTAGATSINMSSLEIASGTPCVLTVDLVATTAGSKVLNSVLQKTNFADINANTNAMRVFNLPTFTIVYDPAVQAAEGVVPLGATTTLTYVIDNSTNPLPFYLGETGPVVNAFTHEFDFGSNNVLNVNGTPTSLNCGTLNTPTVSPNPNFVLVGATAVPANGICSITVPVTTMFAGEYTVDNTTTNLISEITIAGDNITADVAGTLKIALATPFTFTKGFAPAVLLPNGVSRLTFTISNPNPFAVPLVSFVDNLPQVGGSMRVAPTPSYSHTNCGTPTVNDGNVAGDLTINISNLRIPATGTNCVIQVNVQTDILGINTNTTNALNTPAETVDTDTAQATLEVLNVTAPVLSARFEPSPIVAGTYQFPDVATYLIFTLDARTNPSVLVGGIAFTATLPSTITAANPSNITTTCATNPSTPPTLVGQNFSFSNGQMGNTICEIIVPIETVDDSPTDYNATVTTSQLTAFGVTPGAATSATLEVSAFGSVSSSLTVSNTRLLTNVGITTLTYNIQNNSDGYIRYFDFALPLPANVLVADPSGLTLSGGCSMSQDDINNAVSGDRQTLTINNLTIPPRLPDPQAECQMSFNVRATVRGTYSISSVIADYRPGPDPGSPGTARNVSMGGTTIYALDPPVVTMAVNPTSILVKKETALTYTITNPNTVSFSPLQFTQVLPTDIATATPLLRTSTFGSFQFVCGNFVYIPPSATTFTINLFSVPPGVCNLTVYITSDVVGVHTIPAITVTTDSGDTLQTVLAPPDVDMSGSPDLIQVRVLELPGFQMTFVPSSVASTAPNNETTLTYEINNASTSDLTNLNFTHPLPLGLEIVSASALFTNCTGNSTFDPPTVDAGPIINITNGNAPQGQICTIGVIVRPASSGPHVGALPYTYLTTTSQLTTNEGIIPAASAELLVADPGTPLFAKAYVPNGVTINGISRATYTITNNSLLTLDGVSFTDTLPTNVTVANPYNDIQYSGNCGPGTPFSAPAGGNTIQLTNASIPPQSSCTVSVNVVASVANLSGYTSSTGNLTASGIAPVPGASATLFVADPIPTVAFRRVFANFVPTEVIATSGSTTIYYEISNATNAYPVPNVAFTDTFPAGTVILGGVNFNSCTGSVVSAVSQTVKVSLPSIAANTVCYIGVGIASATPGDYTFSDITMYTAYGTTQSGTGPTLTVIGAPTLTKEFRNAANDSPIDTLVVTQVSTLRFAINNTNTSAVDGLGFIDNLPTGMVVADPADATNGCSDADSILTATPGSGTITLTGGLVGASTSCTITVKVTSTVPGEAVNTTTPLTFVPGSSSSATDTLTIVPLTDLGIAVTDSPDPVEDGQTLIYQATITNTGDYTATDVVVSANLDTKLDNTGDTALPTQGSCNVAANPVVCTLGSIPPNGTAFITFRAPVIIGQTGSISTPFTVGSTSISDGNASNDNVAVLTTISDQTVIQSNDSNRVLALGTWQEVTATGQASGDSYSKTTDSTASLTILSEDAFIEVIYTAGPAGTEYGGTFAIEIDNVVVRTVNTASTSVQYQQRATINYLSSGVHVVRVYPVSGTVAIDAFRGQFPPQPGSAPNAPSPLTSPLGSISDTTPTYEWGPAGGSPTDYYLVVVRDNTNEIVLDEVLAAASCAATCSLTPTTTLPPLGSGLNYSWRVYAINARGATPSAIAQFAINTGAGTTTLLSPTSAVYSTTPTFTWTRVTDATWYQLIIVDTATATTVYDVWTQVSSTGVVCDTTTCSFTIPTEIGLIGTTNFEWYIVPLLEPVPGGPVTVGPVSGPSAFTTTPPTAIAPFGTINQLDAKPAFQLTFVPNASWYTAAVVDGVGNLVSFEWYSAGQICSGDICSIILDTPLLNGNYTWYGRAFTTLTNGYTPWTNGVNFTLSVNTVPQATTLTSPVATPNVTSSSVTFTWAEVVGSTYYNLYVANSSAILANAWYEADAICTDACRVTLPNFSNGVHSWSVQTFGPNGVGAWSDADPVAPGIQLQTFTVAIPVTGTPVLSVPIGNIANPEPAYQWSSASGSTYHNLVVYDPNGIVLFDQWYLNSDICFANTCRVTVGPAITVNDTYSWHVRAFGNNGLGSFAPLRTFKLSLSAPAQPQDADLVEPSGDYVPNGTLPDKPLEDTFVYQWDSISFANYYLLTIRNSLTAEVKLSQWYRADVLNCTNSGIDPCSIFPGLALTNGSYDWTIQPYGPGGLGPVSNPKLFTINGGTVVAEAITSPVGGSTVNVSAPRFEWARNSNGTYYRLEITRVSDGVILWNQWYSTVQAFCDTNPTCIADPILDLYDGSYSVRLETYGPNGSTATSGPVVFTVEIPVPATPSLNAPNLATPSDTPTFSWNVSPLAAYYNIIVTNVTTGALITNVWFESSLICSGSTCSTTLSVPLTGTGTYQWTVQGWSSGKYGLISTPVKFRRL